MRFFEFAISEIVWLRLLKAASNYSRAVPVINVSGTAAPHPSCTAVAYGRAGRATADGSEVRQIPLAPDTLRRTNINTGATIVETAIGDVLIMGGMNESLGRRHTRMFCDGCQTQVAVANATGEL